MLKQTLLVLWMSMMTFTIHAQDYRAIDGSDNNIQNPNWGAAGALLTRTTSYGYADGVSTPGGTDRPNPRAISNAIFAQSDLLPDPLNLSDYIWVFGQFIDHDITAVPNDPTENASIPVAFQDQHMNPLGLFPVFIPMSRSMEFPGTGTDASNPREHFNDITAFIDGSGVYGSDSTRAAYLRSFSGGKIRMSAGDLLPFNTTTGEMNDSHDANAPAMDNENPFNDLLFVAGDSRANENPLLTSFHTLFAREHNRMCDELLAKHPDWTDEQLYQYARKMIGGYIQNIVYREWLPAMGIDLPVYTGYQADVNPGISNVFSAAAFRFHTLINSQILRMDGDGNTIPEGNLTLKDAFFAPLEVVNGGGLDPLFKGMGTQIEQDFDTKMIDDLRNFLFGPPGSGAGGLDLAAININRGRERGLPDFNTIRADLGLSTYNSFADLCSNTALNAELENLYGDINSIDPFIGMLTENHMPNALYGETVLKIVANQFLVLRDGDRYYFENDPMLTDEDIGAIKATSLRELIMRNTNITVMQSNVFTAMPHDSICQALGDLAELGGLVMTEDGEAIAGVSVELTDESIGAVAALSTELGQYAITDLPTCDHYTVKASKNDNHRNGVSTYDIVLATRHILDIFPLDSPYKMIAADVNKSNSISTIDIIEMRRLILALTEEFEENTSWRFVPADYEFADPQNPFNEDFEQAAYLDVLTETSNLNFIGIKIGDLNASVDPGQFQTADHRSVGTFTFKTRDRSFEAGELVQVDFSAEDIASLAGYQYSLHFDPQVLSFASVEPLALNQLSAANFAVYADKGLITSSWNGQAAKEEAPLFRISFRANTSGQLSDLLRMSSEHTTAEAYTQELDLMDVELAFDQEAKAPVFESSFQLFQNSPNPFKENTSVRFFMPEAASVQLTVYNVSGQEVYSETLGGTQGINEISIHAEKLNTSGMLYYQLQTPFGTASRKMMRY